MKARTLILAVALAGSLVSGLAHAADPAAQALYEEGRQAAQAHDYALACRKFKESQDREPAPGTLLNLADCEESAGRLVDARAYFDSASRLFRAGDERIAYAKGRVAALERRIPTLTLRLDPTAPTDTTVERDGVPVDRGTLGAVTPVDPGEHIIVVRASHRTDMRTTVRLGDGEKREVELSVGEPGVSAPVLKKDELVTPVPPVTPSGGDAKTPGATESSTTSGGNASLRTAAIAAFGVGAVGLGFGIAGGLITMSAKNTVNDPNICSPQFCNSTGQAAESRGKTWGAVSTVGFIAAGVGAAAGVTFWLVGQPHKAAVGSTGGLSVGALPGGGSVGWTTSF